jgi:hypothetical protein
MKRILLLISIFIFLSSISFADEYVLVMSKDDNVCQHMLKLYNDDLKKYGEIKYSQHKEFNTIKWEKRNYLLSMFSGKMKGDQPILISKFDINNDGKPEIIVKDEHRTLKGIDSDAFYVFREGDLNYYQNGVIINDEFANKAIGAWGGVFNKKPFEGNVYSLYGLPAFETFTIPETKESSKFYYSLGGWFYFHPFLFGKKYFISMNDWHPDMVGKWEVILSFTLGNELKDTCYFIKVCGDIDEKKGGK